MALHIRWIVLSQNLVLEMEYHGHPQPRNIGPVRCLLSGACSEAFLVWGSRESDMNNATGV